MDETTAKTTLTLVECLNRALSENVYQREQIRARDGQIAGLEARLGERKSKVYPDGHPEATLYADTVVLPPLKEAEEARAACEEGNVPVEKVPSFPQLESEEVRGALGAREGETTLEAVARWQGDWDVQAATLDTLRERVEEAENAKQAALDTLRASRRGGALEALSGEELRVVVDAVGEALTAARRQHGVGENDVYSGPEVDAYKVVVRELNERRAEEAMRTAREHDDGTARWPGDGP